MSVEVRKRKEETTENLIRRFMRKVKKEGILEEFMRRQHYTKPAVRRREEHIRRKTYLEKQKEKHDRMMSALDD